MEDNNLTNENAETFSKLGELDSYNTVEDRRKFMNSLSVSEQISVARANMGIVKKDGRLYNIHTKQYLS